MASVNPNRAPKQAYRTIQHINRHKRMLLGLSIPKAREDKIPWGYTESPEDSRLLLPEERALRLLLKAREYLYTCSLEEVARWLADETKIPISTEGLRKILKERTPFQEIMLDYDKRESAYRDLSA